MPLGLMVHTFNPPLGEQRQVRSLWVWASLFFMPNSREARAIQGDLYSKRNKKGKWKVITISQKLQGFLSQCLLRCLFCDAGKKNEASHSSSVFKRNKIKFVNYQQIEYLDYMDGLNPAIIFLISVYLP